MIEIGTVIKAYIEVIKLCAEGKQRLENVGEMWNLFTRQKKWGRRKRKKQEARKSKLKADSLHCVSEFGGKITCAISTQGNI